MEDSSNSNSESEYEADFVVPDDEIENEFTFKPQKFARKRRTRLRRNEEDDLELIRENLQNEKKQKQYETDNESSVESGEIPELPNSSLAEEIFGTSVFDPPKKNDREFEPAELKEQYLTLEDKIIEERDIPERLQREFSNRPTLTTFESEEESKWLCLRMIGKFPDLDIDELKGKIIAFLEFYRTENLEVPFISRYKLDYLLPELNSDQQLWLLANWDKEWGYLQSRKNHYYESFYEGAENAKVLVSGQIDEKINVLSVDTIPQTVMKLLNETTEDYIWELSDLEVFKDTHLYTHYGLERMKKSGYHPLTLARKNKIYEFFRETCLTPDEFTTNISQNSLVHPIPQPLNRPETIAFDFKCRDFPLEINVMNAACQLQSAELAADPVFRSLVRKKYLDNVKIFTAPTEKGRYELTVFHPYYRVKQLRGKDFKTWTAELWAEVLYCEKYGLITVDIKLPWEFQEDIIYTFFKTFFIGEENNETMKEWNIYKDEVLRKAVSIVYSKLTQNVRDSLTMKSEDFIVLKIQQAFFEILNKAPPANHKGESLTIFSFVSVLSENMHNRVALAVCNPEGIILETGKFDELFVRPPEKASENEKEKYRSEYKKLLLLLFRYQPGLLVVGCASLRSVQVRRSLGQIIEEVISGKFSEIFENEFEEETLLEAPIISMENIEVAELVSFTHKSIQENSDKLERIAISLARYIQDPAAETLNLWPISEKNFICSLKFHDLQSLLNDQKLLRALETVAVDFIAQKGVLINSVIPFQHKHSIIEFIPGLGPVKANALLKGLKTRLGSRLVMRAQLLTKSLLTPEVYENSAAFIRIEYVEDETDPLDSTRIHPKEYKRARIMAESALGIKLPDEDIIPAIMKQPELLDELDLEAYSKRQETDIKHLLDMIVKELNTPFASPFRKYSEPHPLDLLYFCTKESRHTLKKGSLIEVTVIEFDEAKMRLKTALRCRLIGFVAEKNMSESKVLEQKEIEKYQKNICLKARILEISASLKNEKDLFFEVDLSILKSDIYNHGKFVNIEVDDSFLYDENDWIEEAIMDDENRTGQKYVPRVVNHSEYKNIGYNTAIEELARKDIGSFVFRPSSKGQDHLTLTWKFYDNIYSHIDIIEEAKPANNMLGQKFHIANDIYENLNEIVEKYVKPCEKLVKDSLIHPKFSDNPIGIEHIKKSIENEKELRPTTIPYKITVSSKYPQFFILIYMPKNEVISEYIKVKPKGLFFHEAYHPSINFLISWFKKHQNDHVYQHQLKRSKEPVIDSKTYQAIPGEEETESQADYESSWAQSEPSNTGPAQNSWGPKQISSFNPVSKKTPLPNETPFMSTPRIGASEWSGSGTLKETPRADNWEHTRNFESWAPKDLPQVPNNWESASEISYPSEPSGKSCYKCKEPGHFSRECTSSERESKCFNCGESGHMSRECTEERRPRRGRGRRGDGERRGRTDDSSDQGSSFAGQVGWSGDTPEGGSSWGPSESTWQESAGSSSDWTDEEANSTWATKEEGKESSSWAGGESGSSSGWGETGSSSWSASNQEENSGWGKEEAEQESYGEESGSSWGLPGSSGGWGDSASVENTRADLQTEVTEEKKEAQGSWGNPSNSQPANWSNEKSSW